MAEEGGSMEMSSPRDDEMRAASPTHEPAVSNFIGDRFQVFVEVCLKSTSAARHQEIQVAIESMLRKQLSYSEGPVHIPEAEEAYLFQNVESVYICENDAEVNGNAVLLFWQVALSVKVFQLNEEGPGDEVDTPDELPSFQEWLLPARQFHGVWESLIYDTGLKQRLLRYSETALLYSDRGVDQNLVSWNRVILLHGPPGTGKTSLCKALAQKLSIRFSERYRSAQLIEVNAHSLFSKWFSESGKLVSKLFQKIHEFVEDEEALVFVLIDEVESLAAARQAALSGSEPSDSIRVVNALLTQLDKLKNCRNIVVLTTSNITGAVDIAFVDRADIKAYVGPPTLEARYEILRSCFKELQRTQIVTASSDEAEILSYRSLISRMQNSCCSETSVSRDLLACAESTKGLSARMLRKLPFLAHASMVSRCSVEAHAFLGALKQTAEREVCERAN